MSRLVDITANEYTTDTPSNRQEEEDHLQRAITESLNASGVQSPQTMPPPPPLPQPQQSGVTTNGDSAVYFGPANRPEYDPDEWAMVRLKTHEGDPEPSRRVRIPGMPAFLRCRWDIAWRKHRIGALLMIFHQIPSARNALLQSGEVPGYGYGNKSDWWTGQPILPPGVQDSNGWDNDECPPWSDELHRLMAFLDGTERSYGTADTFSRARYATTMEALDPEKDFFTSFFESQSAEAPAENIGALVSFVEIVSLDDLELQTQDHFGLLDLQIPKDVDPTAETLYNALDFIFLADPRLTREDPSSGRMAWITHPSDVFTCRVQGDDGLPRRIEIPETLYLDRYMKGNGTKIQELQRDMLTLLDAYGASVQKEESLVRWVNPKTNKVYDRRVISKAALQRCREKVRKIKNRAFWREHEQAPAGEEEEYYLPERAGEPTLLADEAHVVAHYEDQIRQLEDQVAEIERIMKGM